MKMRAVRFTQRGNRAKLVEVDRPVPRDGEVLLRVVGAGLCHSDLAIMAEPDGGIGPEPPFTLGHEIVGRVVAVGPNVTEVAMGDVVAVYGPRGCMNCS
ncbi:MAG: NAD(P)-dependent alcohol dehydrogenase, partial [Comamonadaceae bacterium]